MRRTARWLTGAWQARAGAISAVVVALIGIAAVAPSFSAPVHWTTDALFYEAQMLELRGESQATALNRAFDPARVKAMTHSALGGRVNAAWIHYSARFYRRRWIMPVVAAGLYPIAGERSTLYASMLGYLAAGLLLLALLRRRFRAEVSLVATAICLMLPPVRAFATLPLSDSWGLALEIGSFLAAVTALERGGRWIGAWAVTMLLLSLARDATIVLVLAVAWFWMLTRTRRAAGVLAAGVAASIPAPLLFSVPVVQELSWVLDGFHIPHPASWSLVAGHLPHALVSLVRADLAYPAGLSLPVLAYMVGALLIAAVVYMLLRSPRRDAFFVLARAALPGSVLTVLLAVGYSDMRVELVFIPTVAVALAFSLQRLVDRRRATSTSRRARRTGPARERVPATSP